MDEQLKFIVTVLASTLDPDARAAAEAHLARLERTPGVVQRLLQLTADMGNDNSRLNLPMEVRQSAVLRLKNLTVDYWSIKAGEANRFSDGDRQVLKKNILEAVIFTPVPKLRVQLLEVFFTIVKFDFPKEWPDVVPAIVANLKTGDLQRVSGGLSALHMVFRRYQYADSGIAEKREVRHALVAQLFPMLLGIWDAAVKLCQGDNAEHKRVGYEMLDDLSQIFYRGMQMSMPPYLVNETVMNTWLSAFLAVFRMPITAEELKAAGIKDIEEQSGDHPLMSAKKWCIHSLSRMFSVYGRPNHVTDEGLPFAKMFMAKFIQPSMQTALAFLEARQKGAVVSRRVLQISYHLLSNCVPYKDLYGPVLRPNLGVILQNLLKTFCLSDYELVMFKEDPQEFIRRDLDVMEQFHDPRVSATNLLIELVKIRTADCLELVLNACTSIMNDYINAAPGQGNWRLKEGALRILGSLKKLLLTDENLAGQLEPLLGRHVLPELVGTNVLLRARAAWVVGHYARLAYKDEGLYAVATRGVCACLLDAELPVQVEGAIAVMKLVQNKKARDFLRPELPKILEKFLQLIDEIGNQEVIGTLTKMLEIYAKDIAPFAVQMAQKLTEMFLEAIKADADDDEAAINAQELLVSLNTILYSTGDLPAELKEQLLAHLEPVLKPIHDILFCPDGLEFFDELFEMVTCLTYFPQRISDYMWSLYPKIIKAWDYAADYISSMHPAIDNYIGKDAARFASSRFENISYPQMTLLVCKKVLEDDDMERDGMFAARLIFTIFAHCKQGMVDSLVPDVLRLITGRLLKAEFEALRVELCNCLSAIALYSPAVFAEGLKVALPAETQKAVLEKWISTLATIKNDSRSQRLGVAGMTFVCHLPLAQLPPSVQEKLPQMLVMAIQLLVQQQKDNAAAEEREKKRQQRKEAEAADDGDEEDGDEDDGEDGEGDEDLDEDDLEVDDEELDEAGFGSDTEYESFQNVAADEDAAVVKEKAPSATMKMYQRQVANVISRMEEDIAEFANPTQDLDGYIVFVDSMMKLHQNEATFAQQWSQRLPADVRTAMSMVSTEGMSRKKKAAEAAPAKA